MNEQMCPLCKASKTNEHYSAFENVYAVKKLRQYFKCVNCELVFLNPSLRVQAEEERQRYIEHDNNENDQGYCNFLLKAWRPLKLKLNQNAVGLDYGCGPNPVLANLIRAEGFQVDHYDPYFFNTKIKAKYDFIISTEVIEHVYDLNLFFMNLSKLLNSAGFLSLMTEFLNADIDFKLWRYRQDKTHVCFFSKKCFDYICSEFNFTIEHYDKKRIIILKNQL